MVFVDSEYGRAEASKYGRTKVFLVIESSGMVLEIIWVELMCAYVGFCFIDVSIYVGSVCIVMFGFCGWCYDFSVMIIAFV